MIRILKNQRSWAWQLAPLALLGGAWTPAAAQDDAGELAPVTVTGSADARTEGSGSYTTRSMGTATGLALSIRETPQSVSVMTRQEIADRGLESTIDVLDQSPGISIWRSDSNRQRVTARGFTVSNFQFDGLASPINNFWNFGATDMDTAFYDRVEVVRGATGLLSGAGDPSATVNFIRKQPLREFAGSVGLTAGRWNLRRAEFDLSASLAADGRVRGRLVGFHSDSDSYVSFFGQRRKGLYGAVAVDLTPATRLNAGVEYQRNDSPGMAAGFPLFYRDGGRADFDRSVANNTDWAHFGNENTNAFVDLQHRFGNRWTVRAAYTRNDGNYRMRYLYRDGYPDRATGLGMRGSFIHYRGDRERDAAHLMASGPLQAFGRTHELAFGWMTVDDRIAIRSHAPLTRPALGSFMLWRQPHIAEPLWSPASTLSDKTDIRQSGAYGVGRFALAEGLHLIAGARLSRWRIDQDYFGSVRQYRYTDVVTPYAGLLWDLNDTYTAYASYTGIYTPQNARDPQGAILDPVEGRAFEAGLKAAWLGGRLNGAVALFETQQDHLAQAIPGVTVQGRPDTQAYHAVNGARIRGIELEVAGEVAPRWQLSASLTHFRGKDGEGNPTDTTQPRNLLKLFATHRFDGALQSLTLGGGVRWQSRIWQTATSPLGRVAVEQEAYAVASLMARYQFSPRLAATLHVDNLFDKQYYSQIGFYNQGWWGEPRNVTLSLQAKF